MTSRTNPPAAAELCVGQGRFFSYALPQGWRVGEDGQFALTLVAPDQKALTVMAGNAGYPANYAPVRFVYEKLMALGPQNLQISQPRQTTPVAGFSQAYQFEVTYQIQGVPCRGLVKCHVATSYDTSVLAMTAALADASQWAGYAAWLPLVADQIAATDGAAFGMRGIMQQNLQNSAAYAEAARQDRDWSQRNWQQVTDERNAALDRRNFEFRENLGAVQNYLNPHDNRPPLELPAKYQYYWVNRQGNILGTDDSSADPNVGSTGDWARMPRYRP
ncbi:MAG: hypothetical protein IH623_01145 [Verrucomicrobia bacterium]|nr:hypothetical protein [Verrucomicrobiota bacterium]